MKLDGDDRQQRNWLVKSSTRILGPFSVEDVGQLLLKKHISIIDEIRRPDGRWKYIREHQIFDEVVGELRREQENSADLTQTQTSTATSTAFTHSSATITKTMDLNINTSTGRPEGDEMTPTPTPTPILARSDAAPFGEGGVKELKGVRETTLAGHSSEAYGHARDRRVRDEVKRTRSNARWIILAVVVAVGAVLYLLQMRKTMRREEGYETLISEAIRYRNMQLYEKSLAAYRKASQIREPDAAVQSQMALVLIALDRQTIQGRRILEREGSDDKNGRGQVIDANLGIAISYILEGSLKEAEDALQKVLVLEPQNFVARLNLAIIALRKGDAGDALHQLEDLARRNPPHPLMLLARALALIESGGARDVQRARSLSEEIRSYLARSSQLREELLLINAAVLPWNEPSVEGAVADFLAQSMYQTNQFVHDLRLDWRIADWDLLDRHCKALVGRLPPRARAKAVRALCLAEAGRDAESHKLLAEAISESPKDPLILFTQASLYYRSGLRNEAYAVLRLPELAAIPAHETLLGKICLDQGDLACAEKSFRLVLQSGFDLTAVAGLAAVLQRQDRRQEAASLLRDGIERDPMYLPFIELRDGENR